MTAFAAVTVLAAAAPDSPSGDPQASTSDSTRAATSSQPTRRPTGTIDFVWYWTSGRLALAGVNPFDPSAVGSPERVLEAAGEAALLRGPSCPGGVPCWPPWTLSLVLPFSLLPFGLATQLWLILNVLLVSASLIALHRGLGADRGSLPACAAATACFYPIFQSLIFGQLSVVLLACLAGFMLAMSRDRPFLAGVLLAPLSIKPHLFLVFGAILLWRVVRERRTPVLYGVGLGVVLLLLPILFLAPASFGQWLGNFDSAAATAGEVAVGTWKAATLVGFLRTLSFSFSGTVPVWPLWVLPTVGLLFAVAWLRGSGAGLSLTRQTPVLLCLSYMSAPYGWVFDQAILLTLQIAIVIRAFGEDRSRASRFAVLATLIGIQLVAILMGLREGVGQHEFFWIPVAMLVVWLWQARRIGTQSVAESVARETA